MHTSFTLPSHFFHGFRKAFLKQLFSVLEIVRSKTEAESKLKLLKKKSNISTSKFQKNQLNSGCSTNLYTKPDHLFAFKQVQSGSY